MPRPGPSPGLSSAAVAPSRPARRPYVGIADGRATLAGLAEVCWPEEAAVDPALEGEFSEFMLGRCPIRRGPGQTFAR